MNSDFLHSSRDLKERGTLYAFGSNSAGQLGIGTASDVSIPSRAVRSLGYSDHDTESQFPCPTQIQCGGNHTMFLDYKHGLWTSGRNVENQCMHTKESRAALSVTEAEEEEEPRERLPEDHLFRFIPDPKFLTTSIAATWTASFTVKNELAGDTRTAISCVGEGRNGELGLSRLVEAVPHPRLINSFPSSPDVQIQAISASLQHTVVLLADGSVWGWGDGRKGQLGEPKERVYEPRPISFGVPFAVNAVSCGRDFTFLVSQPSDGQYVILGPDRWRGTQCGPQSVSGWKEVHTSWGGIYVLFADGNLISWGRNDHGQLAPRDVPRLASMAVGSEHCIAITQSDPVSGDLGGQLIAWGWGEHGNCGPMRAGAKYSSGINRDWNVIDVPGLDWTTAKDAVLGAGCATSFIWVPES